MNFVYFKFLFVNTIKRKPVWITWILFVFTCTCFIIILPVAAKMNTLQVWANTTMAICQTFMGMVAALFTAVLAINVFKDTNEEGTELIVISKPISRIKIVLTKFLLFGFFCLMVNLSTVLLSVFTIFLPRTEIEFYAGLLISMFIGNLITFGLFGSISILLTVKFAKMGVIITNIIITLVFLIYQALTLFVFTTPAKAMDDRYMSAASYIIHDRNTDTGEYKEDVVVKFTPSPTPGNTEHPCKATNWQGMKEFWENDIKSVDPTPILNATDLAGQLALTYLSYQTDKYAERQAHRMFALSRFYNYELTSPASPEIIGGVEDKKTINWIYTGATEIPFTIPGMDEPFALYLPASFGFEGIKPLSATRLRGFTNKIPVGTIKSKEILSSREVFFEQDEWNLYAPMFDLMYKDVFNPENYKTWQGDDWDPVDLPILFSKDTNTIRHYYELVWSCFTGNADKYFTIATDLSKYNNTSYNIKDVNDLNDRFIQFKNYCYWKALEEQSATLNDLSLVGATEMYYRNYLLNEDPFQIIKGLAAVLGVQHEENSWMMRCVPGETNGLLEQNTRAPAINLMNLTWETVKLMETQEEYEKIAPTLAIAKMQKTAEIFDVVCDTSESYLFNSLESPTRASKYSGSANMVEDSWLPYLNGFIKDYAEELGMNINMPLGQNMQYFFYKTSPTLNYWMFAVIWGSISIGLFAAGIVVYNKYDVK